MKLKLSVELNLDELTEIFSFFTEYDSSVTRLVCKWWHDLLTKDVIVVKQIKKNKNQYSNLFKRISRAAELGHLPLLKWARDMGCEWDSYTCSYAALGGHLSILKWLRSTTIHGGEHRELAMGEWNSWTCAFAALGGQLSILKWLQANGCEWDEYTCAYASKEGHLELLKWARANGCKWDSLVCSYSEHHKHIQDYIHSLSLERGESPCKCPRIN